MRQLLFRNTMHQSALNDFFEIGEDSDRLPYQASSPFLDSREGSQAENAQRDETGAGRNKREEAVGKWERKGLRSRTA